jgi:hypothetical protein
MGRGFRAKKSAAIKKLWRSPPFDIVMTAQRNTRRWLLWAAQDSGVEALRDQRAADMPAAMGLQGEKLRLYCWTGHYPEGTKDN